MWRGVELDSDLGHTLGHGLARAQIEGHTVPALVINEQLERRIGFCGGIRGHFIRFQIALECLALDGAIGILPTHAEFVYLSRIDRPNSLQHLDLFILPGPSSPAPTPLPTHHPT